MDYYYNLHNKIRVHIRQNKLNLIDNYEHYFGWATSSEPLSQPNYLIREYADFVSPNSYNQIGNGGYSWENGIWWPQESYATKINVSENNLAFTEYTNYANRATNHYLQLLLVPEGHSLVHSAGITWKGHGIIFPAAGGIGKTTLIARLCTCPEFTFLGDDFVIIDKNGTMYAYPSHLSIYSYHLPLFPQLRGTVYSKYLTVRQQIEKYFDLILPHRMAVTLTRALYWLWSRLYRWLHHSRALPWHQPYVKIPATQLISPEKIDRQTSIDAVVILNRYTGDNMQVSLADKQYLTKLITTVLASEFRYSWPYLHPCSLTNYIDWNQFSQAQNEIIESCFVNKKIYRIDIPFSATPDQLTDFVKQFINQIEY